MPTVYLIPSLLSDNLDSISPYVIDAIRDCRLLFVEDARSARRYLKKLSGNFVIDDFEWIEMSKHQDDSEIFHQFRDALKQERNIGIISEAGCPGVADPGQPLVKIAHESGATVRPLVGPSSILLALMGSGMNGQQFQFVGYLPIDQIERIKTIKSLEAESARKNLTQIFIETPYRNNQLIETLIKNCHAHTLLCIAANLTAPDEFIRTYSISEWKQKQPELHKIPTIFCLLAS